MKVILLEDVAKVGRKYDVKEVAEGHAFNLLIPRGLAEQATEKAIASLEKKREQMDAEKRVRTDLLLKSIDDLEGKTIVVEGKANDKGHLFAGIHEEQIVEAIKSQTNLEVEPEFVALAEHLKEVGEHEITIKIEKKVVTLKLEIQATK